MHNHIVQLYGIPILAHQGIESPCPGHVIEKHSTIFLIRPMLVGSLSTFVYDLVFEYFLARAAFFLFNLPLPLKFNSEKVCCNASFKLV